MLPTIARKVSDPAQTVAQVAHEVSAERLGFFPDGGEDPERDYVETLKVTYTATVSDVMQLLGEADQEDTRILEVGALLGVVSIALARSGYQVTAQDMPGWFDNQGLLDRYTRDGVMTSGVRLEAGPLPYSDAEFDAVICCEVLEHLNFNPAPILREFHRVLKPNGLLYVALPNQAWIAKRLRLLMGKSVHDPIASFTQAIDPSDHTGMHWREYTGAEMKELFEDCRFRVEKQWYRHYSQPRHPNPLRRFLVERLYSAVPSFLPNLVTAGRKL